MRDDFKITIKQTLAKRVNYLCSNPNCRKPTAGPNINPEKATLIGVAAHISAASTNGPRYNPNLDSEERKSINNGIWLCNNCGTLIDKNELHYTVELLREWKSEAENMAESGISGGNSTNNGQIFEKRFDRLQTLLNEVLKEIWSISTTTKPGGEKIEVRTEGRMAFESYYKYFRNPYWQYQSFDPIRPKETFLEYCKEFFISDSPELKRYFEVSIKIVELLKKNSENENYDLFLLEFISKMNYHERVIMFYYILATDNILLLEFVNRNDLFNEIVIEDLIYKDGFGIIE